MNNEKKYCERLEQAIEAIREIFKEATSNKAEAKKSFSELGVTECEKIDSISCNNGCRCNQMVFELEPAKNPNRERIEPKIDHTADPEAFCELKKTYTIQPPNHLKTEDPHMQAIINAAKEDAEKEHRERINQIEQNFKVEQDNKAKERDIQSKLAHDLLERNITQAKERAAKARQISEQLHQGKLGRLLEEAESVKLLKREQVPHIVINFNGAVTINMK